jgi:hypothetical protein
MRVSLVISRSNTDPGHVRAILRDGNDVFMFENDVSEMLSEYMDVLKMDVAGTTKEMVMNADSGYSERI